LGRAKDALLESYAQMTPEALDSLTPEQRHCVYGMLGLRATITMDGTLEVSRTFGEGDLFCGTETRSLPRFESAQHLELRFCALLSNGAQEVRLTHYLR
jgi:hypothetical protein